ncbi:MAG: DUF1156 domain-containing protein [Syntrophomonadaceae bacterium]|nr:DUF1156 domain-containing protein [Syntrophomonadaceae bacterium]
MLDYDKSFIEVQFPVSKVSKESYKERKANLGQTLTGLGKWWGRKPLILARAAILGLLMPVSQDPIKDREVFLKILSMDDEGLWQRKQKSISTQDIYDNLTKSEQQKYFEKDTKGKLKYKKSVTKEERVNLQKLVFNRFSYDQKLTFCIRPEELENISQDQWDIINEHLGTKAANIQELIQQLGEKKFGKTPLVGDCFAGGGSVPFEAARLGCDVYASDLNPIAMLLTWAALNINGASDEEIKELKGFQEKIFNLADKQITEWGIEHNEQGHRANSYLYCHETICPECGYKIPLASSWIIGVRTKTVALLKENNDKGYDIEIISNASKEQINLAESLATIQNSNLKCPHCNMTTPITTIRKDRKVNGTIEYGLRQWGAKEFLPREDDVFQERLYCVRYVKEYVDEKGNLKTERYYQAPTTEDLAREDKVVELLQERFDEWQDKGYIPSNRIEEGYNTSQIIRERGWAYWHQLFNPRQLLLNGLISFLISKEAGSKTKKSIGLLGLNKCTDYNSKLSHWNSNAANEKVEHTFYNQALNTFYVYGSRALEALRVTWFYNINNFNIDIKNNMQVTDARNLTEASHVWITDPPYADAVNYHELSEFFLAWDKKMLLEIFPEWYADSKRALAVTGSGLSFNESMIEIYSNLANHMPENGMQVVMFTHQDPSVWAELTLILWSAGLRVTAAWNIATETDASGLKQGNYVKGTVLLVLRKQESDDTAYFDELYPEVEEEVKRQIDSMRELDDKEDPNFSDADYLLAAYAASLKVLTSYKQIEDIDVKYELSKDRNSGEESPIEKIINESIKIAYDYLTPTGFDSFTWKTLKPEERFYIKGLEFEKDGIYQIGAYQELARGFGVKEYKDLLANTKANQTRLKTAAEWSMKGMSGTDNFGSSLLRNVLAALYQCIKGEDTSKGRNWLKNEVPNYWNQRNTIMELLDFLITLGHHVHMEHWDKEVYYAKMLRELVKNDGV